MKKAGTAVALAVAGALVAWSCGGGGGGSTQPTPSGGGNTSAVTITITGQGGKLAFSPNPATVSPGQLVVFKNNDVTAHHIMLDDGTVQTPDINPGATSPAVAMGTNGSLSYHCIIHPGMVGGFHAFYLLALSEVFGVPRATAAAAAVAAHALSNLPVLVLGLVLLGREGLSLGKVVGVTQSEQELSEVRS